MRSSLAEPPASTSSTRNTISLVRCASLSRFASSRISLPLSAKRSSKHSYEKLFGIAPSETRLRYSNRVNVSWNLQPRPAPKDTCRCGCSLSRIISTFSPPWRGATEIRSSRMRDTRACERLALEARNNSCSLLMSMPVNMRFAPRTIRPKIFRRTLPLSFRGLMRPPICGVMRPAEVMVLVAPDG